MIKEIIVVEGKDDEAAILRAVEADTIATGGSALNEETLRAIELGQKRRGIIIFTDPDHAGERIRKMISQRISGCKHAFLPQAAAYKNGDIGVENAEPEAIRQALAKVRTEYDKQPSQIAWNDLLQCGLIHHAAAADRRLKMGNWLGIGYCNGKQFYKRCQMFQISQEEFQQAYQKLEEGRINTHGS